MCQVADVTTTRMGGSFHIDIADGMAAAKLQVLHQLLNLDIVPDPSCSEDVTPYNIDVAQNLMISETKFLLQSQTQ